MRKVINYNDYLFERIFEAVASKETAVYLSHRLSDLLDKIDHPIANDLFSLGRNAIVSDKVTLLDYDDDDISKFTYTVPSKFIDFIEKENPYYVNKLNNIHIVQTLAEALPDVWTKYRTPSSIGKVINKLYPNKYKPNGTPGEDIESFSNEVKAERKKSEKALERFKIVDGDDIIKYYNQKSYDKKAFAGSKLGGSCMRYEQCSEYIKFYSKNSGVKLVILMSEDDEDKIVGRAVLWDIAEIDGEEVDRKFMDRIYSVTHTDMTLFIEFAKRNGWLYKEEQTMYTDTNIVDPRDGTINHRDLQTVNTFKETGYYPYMDTMKYFHIESGYLTNDESNYDDDDVYTLESTSGGYEGNSGIYVEFYGERIDEDDLTWCELGNDWRYHDDAVYIESEGSYATQGYVDDHFVWSDYHDRFIDNDDCVWSKYHNSDIIESESIEVYKAGASDVENIEDLMKKTTDPRSEDEIGASVIQYESRDDNEYFFDEEDYDNFVKVYSLKYPSSHPNTMAHKIWDADRIFTYNGKKYLDDAGQEAKDKLMGQKRIDF